MSEPAKSLSREISLAGELSRARSCLRDAGITNADLDARFIVEHFSGTTRIDGVKTPDMPIDERTSGDITRALERRAAGEPVHRILGQREFYGLPLGLSAATLEPRPDTETLVDAMLPHVRAAVHRDGRCRILDLGTGTGAIALALLSQEPAATATATDISRQALDTAAANAAALELADRFAVLQSDWFEDISGEFDAIVSNPPYIRTGMLDALPREVRDHDPRAALDGGSDGLDHYRTIALHTGSHLREGGCVGLEVGHDQREAVAEIFRASGFRLFEVVRDLAGIERVLILGR